MISYCADFYIEYSTEIYIEWNVELIFICIQLYLNSGDALWLNKGVLITHGALMYVWNLSVQNLCNVLCCLVIYLLSFTTLNNKSLFVLTYVKA